MLTLNDGRAELWQWDTGRTLAVDADCSQVHFSNKVFGRSIDVDVVDGAAVIPDVLLQTDKDLNVWAFVGTAENGYTKISKTFKINRRNKPADYLFTPTDQITLQTIQSQIGDLADLTTEAKDTLVAAINEAVESGGGSSDAVLYTQQALTDSQKKQARENIDSASSDFVINGTLNGSALTLDKTYNQIHEAVQAGKSAVLRVKYNGVGYALPLIGKSGPSYMFTTVATVNPTITIKLTALVGNPGITWHTARVATYDSDGKMAQMSMDSDPSQPMEIATKQYADASGLPSVTDADNGKVLRVVNSAWSAADMPSGADGKSAYQYAVEGGYTGTEAEFAKKLASDALIVHVTGVNGNLSADKTYADIMDAILAGATVFVDRGERYLPLVSINIEYPSLLFGATTCVNDDTGKVVFEELIEITQNGEVKDGSAIVDIPTTLPNPNALTFTGAVTGRYDGSAPLTVNIPSSGGGSGGSGGLPNWRLIKTLVFSSEIAEIIFSEDDNGAAFAVKEIMIVGTVPSMTSGGYFYCGIETGGLNAVWPTAGKEMRWWLASVDGVLKTMLAVSNTAVTLPADRNFGCPSDLVTIKIGASKGFTADGTLYVYGR